MSTLAWVLLGAAAWIVLGTSLALLVGRMIRYRDRQVPDHLHRNVAPAVPSPRDGRGHSSERSREGSAVSHRRGGTPPA